MALNCCSDPTSPVGLSGVMAILDKVIAGVTVNVAVPDLPLRLAVITEDPPEMPLVSPLEAPPETTVAICGLADVHAATRLTSTTVPSEWVAFAINVCAPP